MEKSGRGTNGILEPEEGKKYITGTTRVFSGYLIFNEVMCVGVWYVGRSGEFMGREAG